MGKTQATRVLITGAGGFVGSCLLARLHADNPSAAFLAVASTPANPLQHVVYVPVDVRSRDIVGVAANFQPTHIFHLAARSSVASADRERLDTMDVSAMGALHLSDAVRLHAPGARVLFSSSAEVYGKAFLSDFPLDEYSPVLPANAYARSKLAAELLLTDRLGSDANLAIMRPLNHTGAGQDSKFVIPSFARQIAEIEKGLRRPEILVGNLDAQRDFMHVSDVVDAYIRVMFSPSPPMEQVEIYNVSSGYLRTIESILTDLRTMSSSESSIIVDPAKVRPTEVPTTRLSSAKLATRTEWTCRSDWMDTLNDVLQRARSDLLSI